MKRILMSLALCFLIVFSAMAQDQGLPDGELIASLKDSNTGIRSSAVMLCGERRLVSAVDTLVEMLKKEKHPGIRVLITLALYQIDDPKVLPTLKKMAFCEKNNMVRNIARSAYLKYNEKLLSTYHE